jgi:glycosyltransferase involved in cell wall biosynthesis
MPWRLKEFLSSRMLLNLLKKLNANQNYDLVNIHTAYPLCSEIDKLLSYLKIPLVFTEHWTAFAFNFNLPENAKSLDRIREIYQKNIPVISVSNFLGKEIKRFSHNSNLNSFVVPNVVDESVFGFKELENQLDKTFFMVNYWREIKDPFPVFEAFRKLLKDYPTAQLRVGGYGPLWTKMEVYVDENQLDKSILLLGKLTKSQIAEEMQNATAFVHSAKFETFSVVCAEALCCGAPVVVTDLECIAEYLNTDSGVLVKENDFYHAMLEVTENNQKYTRKSISERYQKRFSKKSVGELYFHTLKKQMKS